MKGSNFATPYEDHMYAKPNTRSAQPFAATFLVRVAFPAACFTSGCFTGSASNAECGSANDACSAYVEAFCGKFDECGYDFDDCIDNLKGDGIDCAFASAELGDVEQCVLDIDRVACDEFLEDVAWFDESCGELRFNYDDELCLDGRSVGESGNNDEISDDDGGGSGGQCGGSGDSCYGKSSSSTCMTTSGCSWSGATGEPGICTGEATPCSFYEDEDTCAAFFGCLWSEE
jgi:hypothetical protein